MAQGGVGVLMVWVSLSVGGSVGSHPPQEVYILFTTFRGW